MVRFVLDIEQNEIKIINKQKSEFLQMHTFNVDENIHIQSILYGKMYTHLNVGSSIKYLTNNNSIKYQG